MCEYEWVVSILCTVSVLNILNRFRQHCSAGGGKPLQGVSNQCSTNGKREGDSEQKKEEGMKRMCVWVRMCLHCRDQMSPQGW